MKQIKKRTIVLFFIILFLLIINTFIQKGITPWYFTTYLLNYSKGFISRGFVGTIYQEIFALNKHYPYFVLILNKIIASIMFVCIFIYIKNIYKKINNDKIKEYYFYLSLICIPILYLHPNGILKTDWIWILSYLIILKLMETDLNIIKTILISIVSIISLVNHQAFIFVVFPFLLFLLLNNISTLKQKICSVIIITINSITFIICQFFGKGNFTDVYIFVRDNFNKINFDKTFENSPCFNMINFEYNLSVFEHIILLKEDYVRNIILSFFLLFIGILWIVITIFILLKLFKDKKILLLVFCLFIPIPLFFMTSEVIRWILLLRFNLNLMIGYYLQKTEINEIDLFIDNKFFTILLNVSLILNLLFSYIISGMI